VRVLVVDDSTLFRKVVRDVLAGLAGVEVVGVAANGRIALEKIEQLRPDLMTLDVEMPELDGIGVLKELRSDRSAPAAIMLSALTDRNALKTTEALELGAFDFILKPSGKNLADNTEQLRHSLSPRIAAFRASRRALPKHSTQSTNAPEAFPNPSSQSPKVCLIGVSTGGPAALAELLPSFAADFSLPIIIVQHMPAVFTRKLAERLDQKCQLKVQEIEDGMEIRPGNIYIAPGEKQTQVVHGVPYAKLRVTDDPPEKHCRPSVDYLFRHAAQVYGGRALAVVLTGMGDDGTEGCRILKSLGCRVVTQDAPSCVVYGMPRSVAEAGLSNVVAPLNRIKETINELVTGMVLCK